MINKLELMVGEKVRYHPEHKTRCENGVVKQIPKDREGADITNDCVRVVYNCNGEWDRYGDYTSCLTNINDLYYGWDDEGRIGGAIQTERKPFDII